MIDWIFARPLALAGCAALLGNVAIAAPPTEFAAIFWCAAGILLLGTVVLVVRAGRPRIAVLLLLASAAGAQGGFRAAGHDRPHSVIETSHSQIARTPPLVSAALLVERTGEDPFRERAWFVGRADDGTGVLCSWPGAAPTWLLSGARVRVRGQWHTPRSPTNPGELDRARALLRSGVIGRIYLKEISNLEVIEPPGWTDRSDVERASRLIRRAGVAKLRSVFSTEDAGIAAALIFGWRSGVSDEDRLRFERSGTMHLLAISGLHLLLVAAAVRWAARRAGAGPRCSAAITLLVCLAYVPVAGAGAPVRRAAAVMVCAGVSLVRGRSPDAASALGGAALLLILIDPVEPSRVGFWLSFLAAGAIALHARNWRNQWSQRHRLLARFPAVRQDRRIRLRAEAHLLSAIPVALAASAATAPLIALAFGYVTPWSPIVNLAAAPFVTLLMPLFALVSIGIDVAAPPAAALLSGLRTVLDLCDRAPGSCIAVGPPTVLAITVWYAGLLVMYWRPRTGLAALLLAVGLAWPPRLPKPPSLSVLDVGHGQAVLLIDVDGRAALIDGGSRNQPFMGRQVLRPALRNAGVVRLDTVVCTHADRDHWQGIGELVGRVPIDKLVVGPDAPGALVRLAERHGIALHHARDGDVLFGGNEAKLVVIDDGRSASTADGNDRSLVLLATVGTYRVLLPADREEFGTAALLRTSVPRCDVLMATHHGSANPLAGALGARVGATWLFVSTAPRFASEATLRDYQTTRIFRTDRHGAILIRADWDRNLCLQTASGESATIRPP